MIRSLLLTIWIAASLAACSNAPAPAQQNGQDTGPLSLPSTKVVDLTYPYNAETIYWPTANSFRRTVTSQGRTDQGYYYEDGAFSASEHGGTHLDAPIHFWEGARSVDQIPLEHLMGPAIVIDVTQHATSNPDYRITQQDIQAWEANNRPIPDGTILLFRTGFGRHWPNAQRYMGTNQKGPEGVGQLHFPGLHPEAATWLIENRSIRAVGIDTPSIDYGQSQNFRTHQALFERNIPAFENVANLAQVPVQGALVMALPMKIEGGSGAPLRIIAFVP